MSAEFWPWFWNEFLPPILPWVVGIAIAVEILFWVAVILGAGWLGKKILRRARRKRAS